MFGRRGGRREEELYFANSIQIESSKKTEGKKTRLGGRQDVPWITMYPVDIYYQIMFNWKESGSHHSKQFPSDFLTCKSGAQKGHLWESQRDNGFPSAKWWHHTSQRRRKRAVSAGCLAKSFVLFPQKRKKKRKQKRKKKKVAIFLKTITLQAEKPKLSKKSTCDSHVLCRMYFAAPTWFQQHLWKIKPNFAFTVSKQNESKDKCTHTHPCTSTPWDGPQKCPLWAVLLRVSQL